MLTQIKRISTQHPVEEPSAQHLSRPALSRAKLSWWMPNQAENLNVYGYAESVAGQDITPGAVLESWTRTRYRSAKHTLFTTSKYMYKVAS